MAVTYEIRKQVDDKDVLLGTLAFDDQMNGVLRLNGSTPAHAELKAHWEELEQRKTVMLEVPVAETKPDGRVIRYEDIQEISRDNPDFHFAVVQYMGRAWGYNLSEKL